MTAAAPVKWRKLPPVNGFYVYALFGVDKSAPLYVGQSTNWLGRVGNHVTDPEKRAVVMHVEVARCSSKEAMDRMEQELIALHCPPWNSAGIPEAVRLQRRADQRDEMRRQLVDVRFLTTAEAAEHVGCHPGYILAQAARGEIQSIDAGRGRGRRYRREWLDEWMANPKRRRTRRDRAAS